MYVEPKGAPKVMVESGYLMVRVYINGSGWEEKHKINFGKGGAGRERGTMCW